MTPCSQYGSAPAQYGSVPAQLRKLGHFSSLAVGRTDHSGSILAVCVQLDAGGSRMVHAPHQHLQVGGSNLCVPSKSLRQLQLCMLASTVHGSVLCRRRMWAGLLEPEAALPPPFSVPCHPPLRRAWRVDHCAMVVAGLLPSLAANNGHMRKTLSTSQGNFGLDCLLVQRRRRRRACSRPLPGLHAAVPTWR